MYTYTSGGSAEGSSSPILLPSDVASPISRVPTLDHGTISTVPMHGTTTRGLIGARLRADMNIRREGGDGTVHCVQVEGA